MRPAADRVMPATRRKRVPADTGHGDSTGEDDAGAHPGAEPVLYGRSRSLPRRDAQFCVARDRALCQRVGRSRRIPQGTLCQGRRDRPAGAGVSGRVRRRARRPVHEDRGLAGTGARRCRRHQRQPDEPHHRLAADRARRAARGQGPRAAGGAVGPKNFRAGDHRARRRLRCRQFAHQGAARRRSLCRQRRKDVYHLGHAGRLSDRCGAYRRRGRGRRQPAADRGRYAGPVADQS